MPAPSVKRHRTEDGVVTFLTVSFPSAKEQKREVRNKTAHENVIDRFATAEEVANFEKYMADEEGLSDEPGMSDAKDGDQEAGNPEQITAQGAVPIFSFDAAYIDPAGLVEGRTVSECQEETEQDLDAEDKSDLEEYESAIRGDRDEMLEFLHVTASARALEKMKDLDLKADNGVKAVCREEGDARKGYSIDWSKPDAVGWESAADNSRLSPRTIDLVISFFQSREHTDRTECEEYCLTAYLSESVGLHGVGQRPLNFHTYPSEFQFPDSYMVEIIDITVTNPALMTLFYITSEQLDRNMFAAAKQAYGDFVPEYTYVGNIALSSHHREELFVWRIVAPVGRPLAADCRRLGLRVNQDKYISILKHFVDFVCEPLRLRFGGDVDPFTSDRDWPVVLHNPHLNEFNIVVRPDWSGIACVLLWAAPPVTMLPFGASFSGFFNLLGWVDDGSSEWLSFRNSAHFVGYSREEYELQRLCLYYLREKYPALAEDSRSWYSLFAAMRRGIWMATDLDRISWDCWLKEVNNLERDWFHFEMEPIVCSNSSIAGGFLGEDDSMGWMDMDVD